MARPIVHTSDAMLDAARALVLGGGARSATVSAIARSSGAPKGSIYHRFGSLEDLLATMWIRAVRRSQERFLAALAHDDPVEAAVAGALAVLDATETDRADARLLASLRREDLIETVRSPALRDELVALNRPLYAAFRDLSRRLHGSASRADVERTVCAVADLPQGAIRRHLVADTPFPRALRGQIEAAVRAALCTPDPKGKP